MQYWDVGTFVQIFLLSQSCLMVLPQICSTALSQYWNPILGCWEFCANFFIVPILFNGIAPTMLYGIVPILESNIGMLGIFANFFIVPMLGPNSVPIILIMGPNIVPLLDGYLGSVGIQ